MYLLYIDVVMDVFGKDLAHKVLVQGRQILDGDWTSHLSHVNRPVRFASFSLELHFEASYWWGFVNCTSPSCG